ncbi:uncharacterized protein DS421_14g458710 [Arachis hypogaea]|nr:uncharacterized protein DS421_14g458710 [Arachis hypogaea]
MFTLMSHVVSLSSHRQTLSLQSYIWQSGTTVPPLFVTGYSHRCFLIDSPLHLDRSSWVLATAAASSSHRRSFSSVLGSWPSVLLLCPLWVCCLAIAVVPRLLGLGRRRC